MFHFRHVMMGMMGMTGMIVCRGDPDAGGGEQYTDSSGDHHGSS
jgi:hypothetical protein